MKPRIKLLIILYVALSSFEIDVHGQNLVLNPGFDSYITCPGFGQFSNTYITDWNKPTIGSTDYYHYNCPGIAPVVQAPRSGEGYAGIYCYNYGTEYREYLTGTLSTPLVAGQSYSIEYYVSLNDGYIQAIVEMGAYLSATFPGPVSNALHLNLIPQIENVSGPLQDTAVWKRVNGQFIAQGGEQYITIGNFHNDTTTTISQPGTFGSYGAYYFIEDVSVIADSTTSINDASGNHQPVVFLAPGNILQIESAFNAIFELECYNSSGRLILDKKVAAASQTDLSQLKAGIYLIRINDGEKIYCIKKINIVH